ncbi:hypothetical protein WR25_13937 [Diploscapter pachys]|uniref:Uncharacterized protein n=1 Tax=Diploscapter pachys TaxID=2018661 RepID=A0A2A2K0G0_9BILA|nr:hypothetical protein WR25_13937 [Diploscapter pachys]
MWRFQTASGDGVWPLSKNFTAAPVSVVALTNRGQPFSSVGAIGTPDAYARTAERSTLQQGGPDAGSYHAPAHPHPADMAMRGRSSLTGPLDREPAKRATATNTKGRTPYDARPMPDLVGQQRRQFAAFVHFHHDVRPADEFAAGIELRDRRPIGIGLDALTDRLVLQHVDAFVADAEMVEDRHRAAGKAALREQRAALHEQHHRVVLYDGVDAGVGIVGHGLYPQAAAVLSCSAWSSPPIRPPSAAYTA